MADLLDILDKIYQMTGIPFHFYWKSGEYISQTVGFELGKNPITHDHELLINLVETAQLFSSPVLISENEQIVYGVLQEHTGNIVILGPISVTPMSSSVYMKFASHHNLENLENKLTYRTIQTLRATMALIVQLLTQINMNSEDIPIRGLKQRPETFQPKSVYIRYVLDRKEESDERYAYSLEIDLLDAIRNGDTVRTGLIKDIFLTHLKSVVNKSFKDLEYLACSIIATAAREMVKGGIDQSMARQLEEMGLAQLSRCRSIAEIIGLLSLMLSGFTQCVRQETIEKSPFPYIGQCRQYITSHLSTPFTLVDLAQEVNIHPAYLSRRFKQVVGTGIKQYVQTQRLEAAANRLKYTNEPIPNIAAYFCYPSQSHFGDVFKKHYGLSPKQYRQSEKISENDLY